MTIKHLGGVFGRNPTFNDVTIEGQLTFEGNIDIDSDITWEDNKKAIFGDSGDLEIFHDGNHSYINNVGAGSLFIQDLDGAGDIYLRPKSGQTAIGIYNDNTVEIAHSGNVKLATTSTGISVTGNVAVNAGNGIDFSATSGTGTSELFDDYEEGTWTPTYLGSVSNPTITYDIQVGLYVKIGRLCHAVLRIRTDSVSGGSGNLRIGGLPFLAFSAPTSSMSGGITVNRADSFTTNTPAFGVISGGADYIDLNYDLAANAVTTANLTNAANSNTAIISIVYQTA
jgi:hypothetical protein